MSTIDPPSAPRFGALTCAILCSTINGVNVCGNVLFLNAVARAELGFDGYIISDQKALEDVVFDEYVAALFSNASAKTRNLQQCRVAIKDGCDVYLRGFWMQRLCGEPRAGTAHGAAQERGALRVTDDATFAFLNPHAHATQEMLLSYRGANALVNQQMRSLPCLDFAKGYADVVCTRHMALQKLSRPRMARSTPWCL